MSNQTSRNTFSYYFARDTIQDEIDQLQETVAVRPFIQTEFAITRWDDPGTGSPIPDNAGATLNSEVFIDNNWNQYGNTSLSIIPEAAKPISGKSTLWVNSTDANRLYFNDNAVTSASGGAGDVVGPASAVDNQLVRYDGTTGKLIQDSPNTVLDDSGNLTVNTLSASSVNGVLDICGKTGSFLTDSITTWTNDDRVKSSSILINNNDDISGVGSVSFLTEAVNPGGVNTLWYDGTDAFIGSTNLTSGISSTGTINDNRIVRYNGTTGNSIQSSGVTIDDSDNITSPGQLNIDNIAENVSLDGVDINGTKFASSGLINDVIHIRTSTVNATVGVQVEDTRFKAGGKILGVESMSLNIESTNPGGANTLWYDGTDAYFGTNNLTSGGSGDVIGSTPSTDNAIARYDGTTGKIIQDSGVTIDDSGFINGIAGLNDNIFDTVVVSGTLLGNNGTNYGTINFLAMLLGNVVYLTVGNRTPIDMSADSTLEVANVIPTGFRPDTTKNQELILKLTGQYKTNTYPRNQAFMLNNGSFVIFYDSENNTNFPAGDTQWDQFIFTYPLRDL